MMVGAIVAIGFAGVLTGSVLVEQRAPDLQPEHQGHRAGDELELSNLKTWTYPDESASYTITATDTAAADNTPGRQQFSGWLMATSSYSTSSLVAGLNSHLPVMELRLCAGLGNATSHCGNIVNNNGGNSTAYFSIDRLTNLPG